ncbi:MAG: hypothetical protein II992_00200 [Lachnospiraceae bacterium]|nr:hypothetical protein [Lachnospiraceae bacterium]
MSKQEMNKRGQHGNVLLSDQEVEKLEKDFGKEVTAVAIDFLDKYIEEKDYKPTNHNLAIRKWVVDAVKGELAERPRREMVDKVVELLIENDLSIREAICVLNNTIEKLNDLARSKKIG